MSSVSPPYHYLKKFVPIRAVSLSISDIKKIYERVCPHVKEEANRVISTLKKPDEQSQKDYEKEIERIRESAFRVTITVEGQNNESLYGDNSALFDSSNLPESIKTIFITNITSYEVFSGRKPTNRFELHFDFSKPPLFDSTRIISSPTPNFSNLTIEGDRDSWISSIHGAVMGILENRTRKRSWLHAGFVYDFGLFFLGFPAGFYLCWKLSDIIEKYIQPISVFLSSATYLYVFFVATWGFRGFFEYTKWAFPTVELNTSRDQAKRHRNFWYAIVCALVGQLLWETFFK